MYSSYSKSKENMTKTTKVLKASSHNHTMLVVAAVLSLIVVVMVLTRLYLVEKETVTLRKQVSSLIEKTELQQVGAPVQGIFDTYYK